MLSDKGIRLITVVTYWIAILLGPLVPWASLILTDVAVRHVPLAQALHDFRAHLFAPGYNLFLIGMLNTVPFIAFALLALFHLGMSLWKIPCGRAAGSQGLRVQAWQSPP